MKRFTIHFLHRQTVGQTLEDVFEETLARSKADAVRWGKSIATERGWRFMGVEKYGAISRPVVVNGVRPQDLTVCTWPGKTRAAIRQCEEGK